MIETKDLILHEGADNDWYDLYINLWSQPKVFLYMFAEPCVDEESAKKKTAAYTEMHKQIKTEFFVYDKRLGQAIGIAGIKELAPKQWTVTDIAIGSAFQGQGYGKQILTALITLAFDLCGAKQLAYDCFTKNVASKALARSCGFIYSHSEEAEHTKNGAVVLLDYYILDRDV